MPLVNLPNAGIRRSPDITYMKGGFNLGSTAVPYFSTSMPVEQVAELLQLPSQLPFDPGRPVELQELFQRELREDRVIGEIVPYMRDPGRLRFFNALTVVLLPMNPDAPAQLAPSYGDYPHLAPTPTHPELQDLAVGPIRLTHPEGTDTAGYLAWNLDLIKPVVLDGQHRFWAMKLIMNQPQGQLRELLGQSRVPVLFLILDERVGFIPSDPGTSVIQACRSIFIDLNQEAQQVPTSRLYLLDDRSLGAVCMRGVISQSVVADRRPAAERVAADLRLPLALVDWRGSSAKFDSGPYITSVLALHDVVESLARVPAFGPEDYDGASRAIDSLVANLGLDETPLRNALDTAEAEERPFSFMPATLRAAADSFRTHFGKQIAYPLVRLTPYSELITRYADLGVFGGDLEPWLTLDDRGRDAFVAQLRADDPAPAVLEAWREIKGRYRLAYQVVFQKAIIMALHSMAPSRAAVWAHWGFDGLCAEQEFYDTWLERFNDTFSEALGLAGAASPFYGSGITYGGTTDFRKGRVPAISGFYVYGLLAPLAQWQEAHAFEDICAWIRYGFGQIRPGPKPPIETLYSLHGRPWRDSVTELVTARLDDEGQQVADEDVFELVVRHAATQLERLLSLTETGTDPATNA